MCTSGSPLQAKEPQNPAREWFPPHGEVTGEAEVLFLSLAANVNARGHVEALDKWACFAITATANGELPKSPEWRMAGSTPGDMLKPLDAIYTTRSWSDDELENISVAMQAWHGAGRTDRLTIANLRYNIKKKPEGPKPPGSKKKEGPARWRLAATIFKVASMIKQHGLALRKLLALEMPREEVPSMAEELASAEERVQDLEAEVEVTKVQRDMTSIAENPRRVQRYWCGALRALM